MNITVYLSAYKGHDTSLNKAVADLGTWIGKSGNGLIYGGSKAGLMGILAESALAAGGEVIGVEPAIFIDQELQHEGLTQLIVTQDMSERKAKMIELGDAFIALPGGTGTLEEISEIMSRISLGLLQAPCIIYNHHGYYNGLKQLLDNMIEQGRSTKERQSGICFAESIEDITDYLQTYQDKRNRQDVAER
ncbi:MAG: TIGR00730 family Rossman fold protein [Clostridia bacterium]|nr:TIGR00730 family Rossman fold protein [Clostridia bacterium]